MSAKWTQRVLGAATILALTTSPLYATPVPPGGPMVAPDVFPNPGSPPPFLYSTSGSFSFTSGAGVLNGSYTEVVFDDIFGVTCATCLDFAFQVVNESSSTLAIERVGMPIPLALSADAGFVVNTGTLAPNLVNRGPLGTTAFFFTSGLFPGVDSEFLVIATNATTFRTNGQLGFDAVTLNGQFIIGGVGAVTSEIASPNAPSVPRTEYSVPPRRRPRRTGGRETAQHKPSLSASEGDGKAASFLKTPANEREGHLSPDGQWMAYQSDGEHGRYRIYVKHVPANGREISISSGGGEFPRWSRDGTELFYIESGQKLMRVPVKFGTTFEHFQPVQVIDSLPFFYAVFQVSLFQPASDGKRFLTLLRTEGDSQTASMTIVTNWQTMLRK